MPRGFFYVGWCRPAAYISFDHFGRFWRICRLAAFARIHIQRGTRRAAICAKLARNDRIRRMTAAEMHAADAIAPASPARYPTQGQPYGRCFCMRLVHNAKTWAIFLDIFCCIYIVLKYRPFLNRLQKSVFTRCLWVYDKICRRLFLDWLAQPCGVHFVRLVLGCHTGKFRSWRIFA